MDTFPSQRRANRPIPVNRRHYNFILVPSDPALTQLLLAVGATLTTSAITTKFSDNHYALFELPDTIKIAGRYAFEGEFREGKKLVHSWVPDKIIAPDNTTLLFLNQSKEEPLTIGRTWVRTSHHLLEAPKYLMQNLMNSSTLFVNPSSTLIQHAANLFMLFSTLLIATQKRRQRAELPSHNIFGALRKGDFSLFSCCHIL